MRDTPKVAGLIQPRARPHLCPETCSLAMRSWPYCVLSGQPVRSALRDRRSVTEKWAERGFVERGAPAGPGWFARRFFLQGRHLCGRRGSRVLGARPCVLPGVGGHLPREATALLLSDPDFQPHTHSMFFSLWLSGVLFQKGFLFRLVFWIFIFLFFYSALFLHLFSLVLFWTSMPFSVLD